MYRIILILSVIFFSTPLFADEAEFDRLYSEYQNNLIDGADFAETMQLAIKLHRLAPQVYGRNSAITADVTYNLARLLDDVAGKTFNAGEIVATRLYQEYFSILDEIEAPRDKQYLERYIQFLRAETNSIFLFVNDRNLKKAIRISKKVKLTNIEKGDVEFSFGGIYASRSEHKKARNYYNKSIKSYKKEFGDSHPTIAASLIELLKIDIKEINRNTLTGQNDLLYGRRNAEKKIIRKAKKLHSEAEEKVDAISVILKTLDINTPRLSDSFSEAKDIYDEYTDKFNNFAYSDNAYESAKKIVVSSNDENSGIKITPIERKSPPYPSRAAQTGLEGWVLFQFDISSGGGIMNIRLVEASHDIFVRPALYAASKFIYGPPTRDGQPSEIRGVRVRTDFKLADNNEAEQSDAI